MKNKILPLLTALAAFAMMAQAQDSESLNVAADQADSMNKLDGLVGRAQKRLEYILTNLGNLQTGNGAKKAVASSATLMTFSLTLPICPFFSNGSTFSRTLHWRTQIFFP